LKSKACPGFTSSNCVISEQSQTPVSSYSGSIEIGRHLLG